MSLIVFDNHLHLRRDGRYLEAVKDFIHAGGTHFILAQYPMVSTVIQEKSYRSCYKATLKMAEEIRSQLEVGVFVTVGPYPVDYLKLREHFSRKITVEIMRKGMDEAAELCLEQQCVGIGEIGRPHFPVGDDVLDDSNHILEYGMQKAKEVGVPLVLHTESTTPKQCRELVGLAEKVGLSACKVVKHFSPPLITVKENAGLMPSVLASDKNVREAIGKGYRFLMETDYIDDPRRPGAVLEPKTVPKVTKQLLAEGVMTVDQADIIHVVNPEKTYAITLRE
jgi:TatD-related deoxyribonuclease